MDVMNPILFQQPAVGFPQVDVPSLVFPCNPLHRKTCLMESIVDLVANLEGLEGDARTYDCMKILWTRLHLSDGLGYNPGNCSPPSGMYCRDDSFLRIINENGYAVGCLYAEAKVWLTRDDGVCIFGPTCLVDP